MTRRASGRPKIIFIDRDGVINKDPGDWTKYSYVTAWGEFHFLPGSKEALKLLKDNGIKVIIVSNQAGVSKGYFSKSDLDEVNRKMIEEIRLGGGEVEAVYYCIHQDTDNCACRKPKTGSFEDAAKKYGIDLKDTYFIGDSHVDMAAGKKIGCKTVFVLSGKASRTEMLGWPQQPDYVAKDLLDAVRSVIIGRQGRVR